MKLHAKDTPSLSPDAMLEQLDRVLSSELFRGSERSTKLLRFLVEQTRAGQSDRLKEYTVGTEALGKGDSFDPRFDSIVRSEVSRLRTRLDKYYATEGAGDLVVIALPKGSYVPRFQSRTISPSGAAGAVEELAPPAFRLRAPVAILAGVLVAMIALISYRELTPQSSSQGDVAERAAAASEASAVAIAVLPFLNLSGDASQEFFSDGITEEITATLAKVPDLRLVARTSAFQFKGQNRDIQGIGRQLHATHLIEGSVRKDGNHVRITAQLIEASSGFRVSTESYDGQLRDIFTTQEDIARTIVGALMAPLGLAPGENLVNNRSIAPESYEQYLRAKALVRGRRIPQVNQGIAILEQIVAHDPNYAPAWALLALAYDVAPTTPEWLSGALDEARRTVDASLPKAETAARRAILLDPNLADGHASLGRLQVVRGNLLGAEESYLKALALDPDNPDVLQLYGNLLAEVGRLKESLAMMRRLLSEEPFVPIYGANAAAVLWLNGQDDAAIAILEAIPPSINTGVMLSNIYAATGRYSEAVNAVLAMPSGTLLPGTAESAARLLRTAPAKVASSQALPRLGDLGSVYLHVGAANRALEFYEFEVDVGYSAAISGALLWHPSYARVRKTERFKLYAHKAGLVDYWRAKGWPEFCHPIGAHDYACD
jgi:adenylate cyclase